MHVSVFVLKLDSGRVWFLYKQTRSLVCQIICNLLLYISHLMGLLYISFLADLCLLKKMRFIVPVTLCLLMDKAHPKSNLDLSMKCEYLCSYHFPFVSQMCFYVLWQCSHLSHLADLENTLCPSTNKNSSE